MSEKTKNEKEIRDELVGMIVKHCSCSDDVLELISRLSMLENQRRSKLLATISGLEYKLHAANVEIAGLRATSIGHERVTKHWIGACRDALNRLDEADKLYNESEAAVEWYEQNAKD